MNIPAHQLTRRSALGAVGAGSAAVALAACSASNSNGGEGSSESSKRDDYSGEVKFENFDTSAGTYEPATREHPAKNVPKPIKPDNLNEKSVEGFYQNIAFFMAAFQYLVETGNGGPVRETNFKSKETVSRVEEQYKTQGFPEKSWGEIKIKLSLDTPQPTIEGDNYSWNGKFILDGGSFYVDNGQAHDISQDQRSREETMKMTGTYKDGTWEIDLESGSSASASAGSGSSTGSGSGSGGGLGF